MLSCRVKRDIADPRGNEFNAGPKRPHHGDQPMRTDDAAHERLRGQRQRSATLVIGQADQSGGTFRSLRGRLPLGGRRARRTPGDCGSRPSCDDRTILSGAFLCLSRLPSFERALSDLSQSAGLPSLRAYISKLLRRRGTSKTPDCGEWARRVPRRTDQPGRR